MAMEPVSNTSELIQLVRDALPGITAIAGAFVSGLMTSYYQRSNHRMELRKLEEETADRREDRKYAEVKESIIEHASAATGFFEEAVDFSFAIQSKAKSGKYYKASEDYDRARIRFSDAEARLKFILPDDIDELVVEVGQSVRDFANPRAQRSTDESQIMMKKYGEITHALHQSVHDYLNRLSGEQSKNVASKFTREK